MTYSDLKIPHKINETLTCYIFDSYFVYEDEFDDCKIEFEKNVELLFINNEKLDLETFCQNIMDAQAFSGNFEKPNFNYHFMGTGSFTFEEYMDFHNIIAHSSLNMINFYVFYKKVLSSIGYFVCGLYENDIRDQRKYLTDQEFKNMLAIAKRQKKTLMDAFKRVDDSKMDGLFS